MLVTLMLQRLQHMLYMSFSQINCYDVTALQPILWLKKKYFYLKLVCCAPKCIGRYTNVTIVTAHCSYALSTNCILRCCSVTA